jgi:hypothetical protein
MEKRVVQSVRRMLEGHSLNREALLLGRGGLRSLNLNSCCCHQEVAAKVECFFAPYPQVGDGVVENARLAKKLANLVMSFGDVAIPDLVDSMAAGCGQCVLRGEARD